VITVVVLFRNAPQLQEICLQSLRASHIDDASFLLIDDCSDPALGITRRLLDFRSDIAPADVRIARFHRQMHYTHGLAYALSLAGGGDVLFVSHDMMLTPDCVAVLREVMASDAMIGTVRPVSEHMDWAKRFVVHPPHPPASLDEAMIFSAGIRKLRGAEVVDWPMLIGDAMLIRRELIEKIGVFDPRFYGFMGDIDYGIRAARAGFRHVIAPGAWLHHEGAGTKREAGDPLAQGEGMMRLVETTYAQLREKWGEQHLPPHFRDMRREHFDALHALGPTPADARVAPLPWSDDVGEML
jgi:GT2 family glycosyltransferase